MSLSAGAIPCLRVADLDTAVGYYERRLGFRLINVAGEPPVALLRREGLTLALRRTEPADGTRHPDERGPDAWDAILPAADLAATFDDLSARKASPQVPSVHPFAGPAFTVQDLCGNLLCFSQAPSGPAGTAHRRARSVGRRLRSAGAARAAAAELRPHLERFRSFYQGLANKRDIFYMFFTGGLLHWAVKAATYVPAEVNLVLLGSDLSADERAWIAARMDRPFHHIDLPVNDWPVWDFLFATNESNFGWLDIDCLVLNSAVFDELTRVPPDASVNCVWSYDSGHGFRVANTYLVFINVAAIRALRSQGIPVWACPHDWRGGDRTEHGGKRCFYRVPSRRERRRMHAVVPSDGLGRPHPPGSEAFFDTLSVYQMLALSAGFHTHRVRQLDNPTLGPIVPGEPRRVLPQDMSDELIHVGGISYYHHERFQDPGVRTRYLAADYATLATFAPALPADYLRQRDAVAAELRSFGVEPAQALAGLREYLGAFGGLSPHAVDKALSAQPSSAIPGVP